jgi:hypothetical protein
MFSKGSIIFLKWENKSIAEKLHDEINIVDINDFIT